MSAEVVAPSPAEVAAGVWTIVPHASVARFRVRDKLFGFARGTIPVCAGAVRTGDNGAVESARVELDVAGIDTGNARRDRDLRKPRFLDADGHPRIVVQAGPSGAGTDGWPVTATLSARGRSVAVDLHVAVTAGDHDRVQVRVTGRLDRTGLGMSAPTFIIGRTVDIEVDTEFRLAG